MTPISGYTLEPLSEEALHYSRVYPVVPNRTADGDLRAAVRRDKRSLAFSWWRTSLRGYRVTREFSANASPEMIEHVLRKGVCQ